MEQFAPFLSAITGYLTFHFLTSPKSKINKKLPRVKIKKVHLFPSQKIIIKGRVLHFHHWFDFTILLIISVFVSNKFLDSSITRGFLIGGAFQGLRFADRNIFYKKTEEK